MAALGAWVCKGYLRVLGRNLAVPTKRDMSVIYAAIDRLPSEDMACAEANCEGWGADVRAEISKLHQRGSLYLAAFAAVLAWTAGHVFFPPNDSEPPMPYVWVTLGVCWVMLVAAALHVLAAFRSRTGGIAAPGDLVGAPRQPAIGDPSPHASRRQALKALWQANGELQSLAVLRSNHLILAEAHIRNVLIVAAVGVVFGVVQQLLGV